uniref:Uncharacterized protein n=1 Tax=Salix viminalis TaxID=40686 RepID=A0A6N2NI02_SALVM
MPACAHLTIKVVRHVFHFLDMSYKKRVTSNVTQLSHSQPGQVKSCSQANLISTRVCQSLSKLTSFPRNLRTNHERAIHE